MKQRPQKTKIDSILNLLCFSGMALVVCTIPEGLVLGLQAHGLEHLEWHDAFVVAGVMMLMMIITGITLYQVSRYFLKKRQKHRTVPNTN